MANNDADAAVVLLSGVGDQLPRLRKEFDRLVAQAAAVKARIARQEAAQAMVKAFDPPELEAKAAPAPEGNGKATRLIVSEEEAK